MIAAPWQQSECHYLEESKGAGGAPAEDEGDESE